MCQMFFVAFIFTVRLIDLSIFLTIMSGFLSAGMMLAVSISFNYMFKNSAKTLKYTLQYEYTDSAGKKIVIIVNAYGNSAKLSAYDVFGNAFK